MATKKDSRGVERGSCTACSCAGYDGGTQAKKCVNCGHPPGKHQNMSSSSSTTSSLADALLSVSSIFSPEDSMAAPSDTAISLSPIHQCAFSGCAEETDFDLNTGVQSSYCRQHLGSTIYGSTPDFGQTPSPARDPFSFFHFSSLFRDSDSFGLRTQSDGGAGLDNDWTVDTDAPMSIQTTNPPTSTQTADPVMSIPTLDQPMSIQTANPLVSLYIPPPAASKRDRSYNTDDTSSTTSQTKIDGKAKSRRHKSARSRFHTTPAGPRAFPVKPAWQYDGSQPSQAPVAPSMTMTSSTPFSTASVPPSMASLPQSTTVPLATAPPPGPTVLPSAPAAVTPLNTPGQPTCKLPGCTRPRYVEQTGKVHDFCGRRHATQYSQLGAPAVPAELVCKTPGCSNQRYQNQDGTYFDYCSKYCRDNGHLLASPSTPNLQNPSGYGTCILPGCTRARYRDPANGRVHEYCGRRHATQARQLGIVPSSSNNVVRRASQQEFGVASQKFRRDWDPRKSSCPKVDSVYVVSNSALETRWTAYRQQLSDKRVEEYYHGTKLTCNLSSPPCTDQECGVCGISNTGLDRRCIRKNINFQRFGHGFYLAPNSSKCHDYTQGYNGYRAMLLCDVCPGRKYNLQTDNVQLKGPPGGFNCVFGQVGRSLNYEEIVIYNPDAMVPRYIIVYQRDGVNKIAK